MASQLGIQKRKQGYFPILEKFRVDIPLATKKHYPNVDFVVEGELPDKIKEHLPIFGFRIGLRPEFYALNSGGRGILLSDGNTHLRFKGNDLDGSITMKVAQSPKTHINDIRTVAEKVAMMHFPLDMLNIGDRYELPSFSDKPFSFFQDEAVTNEHMVSDILGYGFEQKGFNRPYKFKAKITYPDIEWRFKPCSTLVFELPSPESDLRFEELYRLAFLHLKFASPKQLRDINDDFVELGRKLTTWHGFVSKLMADNLMVPTSSSHQHQNYVLCHVTDTEVGASRVDHTSTIFDRYKSPDYAKRMESDQLFFSNLQLFLIHALYLADQGYVIDKKRYTGYFDRAYKWHEGFQPDEVPPTIPFFKQMDQAFKQGYDNKDPIPIPEQDLVDIVNRIAAVEMDIEHQRKVTMYQRDIMRKSSQQQVTRRIPGRRNR